VGKVANFLESLLQLMCNIIVFGQRWGQYATQERNRLTGWNFAALGTSAIDAHN
jgi:hypothetical protein